MSDIRVYTTGDVAAFCNVRKMTVARWVDRGELPAHQLPGRGDRRITHEDLLNFMRKNGFPLPSELADGVQAQTDVLVIEDDISAAKAIRRSLVGAGLKVEVANDGFAAGLMLGRIRPALVTLDLSMPGMSGFEVLAVIRNRADFQGMKILVISALPEEKMREAIAAGADDCLQKPFHNADLVEKVRSMLSAGIYSPGASS